MSKTFKCVEHEEEVLEVYPFTGEAGGRKFSLLMPHVSSSAGIAFDSTTAPALALAILEAAGGRDSLGIDVGNAMTDLREYVNEKERATVEAEAQAKLEAEALAFYEAFTGYTHVTALDEATPIDKWLAVARRAREINKEENND